ncbi:hypothetical protein GF325_17915 [Candidatus Bathyarchaeota archaeon]|nr:hypothetical protein [Candidatus Bathyarchaeota archaeon]
MHVPEDDDLLSLKRELLEREWTNEIDKGLQYIKPIIKKEFHVGGVLGVFADPFISLGTRSYIKTARTTALRQMQVAIDCAMDIIKGKSFDLAVDEYFPDFLKLDILYRYSTKDHPKLDDIVSSLREEFTLRIEDTVRLLSANPPRGKETFNSVVDVYRGAYGNDISEAQKAQERQLRRVTDRAECVRVYKDLVKIPFGLRPKVFKVFDKGLEYTLNSYIETLSSRFG